MKRRPSKSELASISIWLRRDSIATVKQMAQREDRSFGAVLRRLLAAALQAEQPQA